jgi:transketolase
MRKAFLETMEKLAGDERIVFLTSDLGFMALESLRDQIPSRFFNVGVCEQNMIGMATGLAQQGLLPFCYSIIPFAVYRPFEFIRNACYQNLPIRIIGMGAGFDYGYAGYTHYGLEDIGVLRTIPNLRIFSPCDSKQASQILSWSYDLEIPIYYRLSKDDSDIGIEKGTGEIKIEGRLDILYVTTGSISKDVLELSKETGASVLIQTELNPIPDDLEKNLRGFSEIIVYEEHVKNGGLGSIVAEVIAECGLSGKLVRKSVGSHMHQIGTKDFLEREHGIK